ncbi:alpha-ketoglutarate-dependent dioxygenase AlkB family protein [Neisseria zalophi]|uniref:Alpha-ketoglutarate-dependent dioxygenase AlkB n=1 Tax=Neisseria zalophi TaxID=640030 RepID=A0A5J6PSA9_9NEIS|nr:alpha-ketoglutarate-dependent dioxygenase AlkB [Neisseria zalophi]QEY25611.1 alpha-ketoglutarate-dependent dioxygenase AlkB [Neisseria zalophi]
MTPDLFTPIPAPEHNLLPADGIVNDYGVIFSGNKADRYFHILMNDIPWQHDEVVLYGKRIHTARRVAWYGERSLAYTYSGITRLALPWHPVLSEIKDAVERHIAAYTPTQFNSCLLNLYTDGNEGMAWHSDDERELGQCPIIASVSFGASRKFVFKHKQTQEKTAMMLTHGQLLVMHGETQRHWLHAIMKSTKIHEPRVSLTFRTIIE